MKKATKKKTVKKKVVQKKTIKSLVAISNLMDLTIVSIAHNKPKNTYKEAVILAYEISANGSKKLKPKQLKDYIKVTKGTFYDVKKYGLD